MICGTFIFFLSEEYKFRVFGSSEIRDISLLMREGRDVWMWNLGGFPRGGKLEKSTKHDTTINTLQIVKRKSNRNEARSSHLCYKLLTIWRLDPLKEWIWWALLIIYQTILIFTLLLRWFSKISNLSLVILIKIIWGWKHNKSDIFA